MPASMFDLSAEVEEALASRVPVVALESTIIAHGMPHPTNLETARELENIVRDSGAVPATIAVIGGRVRVGLTHDDLQYIASAGGVLKVGSADLAYAVSSKCDGATTVAATAFCAARAGIEVFATGGIGGVHRGAELSCDVSGDLYELGRTRIAVVCSGVKALLDIPKTLEVLESLSVPVVGFCTSEFPAFWSRSSGFGINQMDNAAEIADLIRTRRELNQPGGIIIANPIERADEIPRREMERYIETALRDAENRQIRGKDVTPWLLTRLNELTKGRTLKANVALVKSNARVAAQIAGSL
ncbi:MAG TPA: pseudouridine-5'-phosphate glycosidase [Candidatus Rubrimentiphilum sp.]|nr:pseudouridine-5'-phosphate glycosidase [Candidatus Rubrimentiphilum sp.]